MIRQRIEIEGQIERAQSKRDKEHSRGNANSNANVLDFAMIKQVE